MSDSARYYEPSFKKRVIDFYLRNQPNISFRYVADLFQIPGGHVTVKRWCDRYDGTSLSLQHHHRSHCHNRLSRPINYAKLVESVREETNTNLSLRTIQRYGKQNAIRHKRTIKRSHKECEYRDVHSLVIDQQLSSFNWGSFAKNMKVK